MLQLIVLFSGWSFFIWKLQHLRNPPPCCSRRQVAMCVKETHLNSLTSSEGNVKQREGLQAAQYTVTCREGFLPHLDWVTGMKEGIAVKARGRESIWALQNFRYLVSFKKCLRRACLFQVWCQGPGRAQSLVLPLQESVLGSRAAVCVYSWLQWHSLVICHCDPVRPAVVHPCLCFNWALWSSWSAVGSWCSVELVCGSSSRVWSGFDTGPACWH
jgi:hypothetical protein